MKKNKLSKSIAAFLISTLTLPSTLLFASTGCTYPTTLDSWSDKVAGDQLTVADVNQFRCAIEKIEAELGTLPKGSFGSVKLRIEDIDARFVALLGKAGGQTVIGGTAASNNLILQSTSHATRGVVQVGDNLAFDANTPSQFTSRQDDLALSDKVVQRWSGDAAWNITGLAGGVNSRVAYAFNVGSFPLVVAHESASSSAANRVTTVDGLDMTLWPGRGAAFIYDSTTSRWRGSLLGSADYQIVKTADETVNASTTFQNDDHLVVPVSASRTYDFAMCLQLNAASGTPDLKVQFTVPSGTTMKWGPSVEVTAGSGTTPFWTGGQVGTTPNTLLTEASTLTIGSVNGTTGACLQGVITSSTTTGNVQLQWAQNTSNASDTKLLAGSWWRIRPIL